MCTDWEEDIKFSLFEDAMIVHLEKSQRIDNKQIPRTNMVL